MSLFWRHILCAIDNSQHTQSHHSKIEEYTLKHHNVPPFGEKDQLVMKVLLLRQGKTAAITSREEGQLKDIIQLTY